MDFKKILADCLTENDGKSYCPVRVVGGLLIIPAIFVFLGGAVYMLLKHDSIDLQLFAMSLVTMVGAVTTMFSVAIAVKAITDKPLS